MSEGYSATLLTDSTYALATIVTANEIAKTGLFEKIEVFLYPPFENRSFVQALNNIAYIHKVHLAIKQISNLPYKGLIVGCLFSDVVMAKLVTPYAQENNISMFIDSGLWLNNRDVATAYIQTSLEEFSSSGSQVGLITQNTINRRINGVDAKIIIWNKQLIIENHFLERSVTAFNELREAQKILLPEQDILQHMLSSEEVYLLEADKLIATLDLTMDFKDSCQEYMHEVELKRPFFKFTGHYKPWITSLLNPLKKVFLDKVRDTSREIQFDLIRCIEFYDHRQDALESFQEKRGISCCDLKDRSAIIQQLKYIEFLARG